MNINEDDALLVIDIQNDFLPGGALAVEKGDEIIEPVNDVKKRFFENDNLVVLSQDWHPPSHGSFASTHDKDPFASFEQEGLGPVLWPDHCVQGTKGAEFAGDLDLRTSHLILRKGYHPNIDSYSVFLEKDKKTETGLDGYLSCLGVQRVFLCGLAYDYCVFFSAMDAVNKGYEVVLLQDLTRGIDSPKGRAKMVTKEMKDAGVSFLNSDDLA